MSLDRFWSAVADYLEQAKTSPTAAALIELTNRYWDRSSGDAFFAGSGGDEQLFDAIATNPAFTFDWIEADYYWSASDRNGDRVEYVEGDLYLHRGAA